MKSLILTFVVIFLTGCASINSQKINRITVNSSVKETLDILERRGALNDTLCYRTAISLECELLPLTINDPYRQFMHFDVYKENNVTKVLITRWLENKLGKRKDIELTPKQLSKFAEYIEKHRNKLINDKSVSH